MRREALAMAAALAAYGVTDASAETIGSAVRIVNKVTAAAQEATRALTTGAPVGQDEFIEVAPDALGEISLKDDTKLALGPGARLKLDKFVYDPAKASGTIAVDLAKGAFRFVTGRARKPSYLIRSPNASISVRGTVFDVYVDGAGNMWVLLHEGALEVCNASGQCRTLESVCSVVRVGAAGVISPAATLDRQPQAREIDFAKAFPFVIVAPIIDPVPRFPRAEIENGSCAGNGGPVPPFQQRTDAPEIYGPPAPPSFVVPPAAVPAGPALPKAPPAQERAEPTVPTAPVEPNPRLAPSRTAPESKRDDLAAAQRLPAAPGRIPTPPSPTPYVEDHPDEPLDDGPFEGGPASASRPARAKSQRPSERVATSEPVSEHAYPPDRAPAYRPAYETPHERSPEPASEQLALPNWSGFYFGVSAGAGVMNNDVETDCVDNGATLAKPSLYAPRGCAYASARGLRTTTFAPEADGLTAGVTAGFNLQLGSVVSGIEADFAITSLSGTGRSALHVPGDLEAASASHTLNWLSTLRSRIGYAHENWLLYATGGLAVGEAEFSYAMTIPGTGAYAKASRTDTLVGWAAGAGAEYRLGMLSVRGELLHFDLGNEVLSAKGHHASGAVSATTVKPEFDTKGNIGRIGVSLYLD